MSFESIKTITINQLFSIITQFIIDRLGYGWIYNYYWTAYILKALTFLQVPAKISMFVIMIL